MERRIFAISYVVIFIFAILLLRLWYLQVIKGEEYKHIAERNRLRILKIPAPRGIIYDRNGNALVRNIPSFDISMARDSIPEEPEVLAALGKVVGLKPDEIRARIEKSINPLEPVKLRQNVSLKDVARVEARKMEFPGLQVDVVIRREYIYGKLAAHVIGYLGRLTLEQAKDPDYSDVPRTAFIGQWAVEKVFDRALRGIAGRKVIEVDATGKVVRIVGIQKPVKGKDIKLTIDLEIQAEAEKSLEGKRGAVVAIDPNTGEILALASTPSFDPNLFARGISYRAWRRLVSNPGKPLLNRAIQSQYPPGSTFKIITAVAALERGIITDKTRFRCNGKTYLGDRAFRCWKNEGHGEIDLYRAIVESCDVYFYEIGKRLDIDTLARYAMKFGLGESVGIELEGEVTGIVPSTQWKSLVKGEGWYMGETLNAVIGQGYLSATPIQVARFTAALVNGGKLYKLRLLKNSDYAGEIERIIDIRPEYMKLVKKALIGVVSDKGGTGWMARSDVISIGGKTGTTQVIGGDIEGDVPYKYRDHAWFVAFAPEENPQIVVAVFVEHGGYGSTAAAPIAKRVIEAFYYKKIGG